jgi:hypothetical protein
MGGQGRKRLCLYEVADPESVDWATAYLLAHGGFVARCEVKGILKDRGFVPIAFSSTALPGS